MVDNILNDKDEQTDTLSIVSGSGSDSDSEQNSDLKDSLCDSPKSYNSVNNHNSSLSDDDHIRPYTILNDSNRMDMLMEYCCAKCGHYQSTAGTTIPTSPNANNNNNCNNNNNNLSNNKNNLINDFVYKCEKCGFNEFINSVKETMLKESNKPVLKFSVSAILGDKKDCVKVRNGKDIIVYFK